MIFILTIFFKQEKIFNQYFQYLPHFFPPPDTTIFNVSFIFQNTELLTPNTFHIIASLCLAQLADKNQM